MIWLKSNESQVMLCQVKPKIRSRTGQGQVKVRSRSVEDQVKVRSEQVKFRLSPCQRQISVK